ncbi:DNA-directed RNA polymerase II core subunit rpb9, partial [Coemansia sp. RSA 2524]
MASIKFCHECSNMLYPRVNPEFRQLMFACRNCSFEEIADNSCVFRHEVLHTP